jgi:hypothetical protein
VSEYASISDLIVEELAETNKLPKLDVYKGETLAVITQPRVKHARILLAFPAGPIGNLLSKFQFSFLADSRHLAISPSVRWQAPSTVPHDFSTASKTCGAVPNRDLADILFPLSFGQQDRS